jgi:hypothetical protein
MKNLIVFNQRTTKNLPDPLRRIPDTFMPSVALATSFNPDPCIDNGARRPRGPSFAARNLEAGCIVACLSIYAQRWKSLGGAQLDLDLAPSCVV